ncbi:hypothetical protein B5S33_g4357 [[Candida] boidinii]|nr:hypothetical protein B5S30_g4197 [[Candida] boidinii]OWB85688.1 hypothetical protein B5S33_g4357 [[Candida] boidinii]
MMRIESDDYKPSYTSLGVIFAITGNIIISLSLNIQKQAHHRLKDDIEETNGLRSDHHLYSNSDGNSITDIIESSNTNEEPHTSSSKKQKHYTSSIRWWVGFVLMTLGEIGNFVAYGLAPVSIVSPMGVVTIIANSTFIAPVLFHEKIRSRDIIGTLLSAVGVVFMVVSSITSENNNDVNPTPSPDDPPFDPFKYVNSVVMTTRSLIYLFVSSILVVHLISCLKNLNHIRNEKYILFNLTIVSIFGSYTAMSTKLLSTVVEFSSLHDLLTNYISYLLLAVITVTSVFQIKYLNKCLKVANATTVVPIHFVFFTVSVLIGSAIVFKDFENRSAFATFGFFVGALLTFTGVFFICDNKVSTIATQDIDTIITANATTISSANNSIIPPKNDRSAQTADEWTNEDNEFNTNDSNSIEEDFETDVENEPNILEITNTPRGLRTKQSNDNITINTNNNFLLIEDYDSVLIEANDAFNQIKLKLSHPDTTKMNTTNTNNTNTNNSFNENNNDSFLQSLPDILRRKSREFSTESMISDDVASNKDQNHHKIHNLSAITQKQTPQQHLQQQRNNNSSNNNNNNNQQIQNTNIIHQSHFPNGNEIHSLSLLQTSVSTPEFTKIKTNDYTPYNSNSHSRNTSNDYDTNINDNNNNNNSNNANHQLQDPHANNVYIHQQHQHHHHPHQNHLNNRNLQFSEAYKDNNNIKTSLLKNSSSYKKHSNNAKLNDNPKNRRQSLSELSHPGWGLPPIRLLNNNVKQNSKAHVLGKGYFAIGGNGGILLSMLNNAIDDEDEDDNYEDNDKQERRSLNYSVGSGSAGGGGNVNGTRSGIEQINAAMASDRNKFDISSTRGTKSIPSSFHDNSSQPTFFDHHSVQGNGSLYGSTTDSHSNRDVFIDHRKNIAQMKPAELESLLHQQYL